MQSSESLQKEKPSRMITEHAQQNLSEQFDAVLINYLGNKCDALGKLVLTNFRCIFIATKETIYHDNQIKFDFPIGYILRCESSSESINKSMVFYLEITTKFLLSFKLKSSSPSLVKGSEYINKTMGTEDLMFGERRTDILDDMDFCKKWEFYSSVIVLESQDAVCFDNLGWNTLPMYPSIFKIPKAFIDRRNPTERIMMLSLTCEQKKKVGLWRTGPGRPDPQEDKWVPIAAKKADNIVIQIKNRGLGSNKSQATQLLELDGPVQLRESFSKMFYCSCYQSEQLSVQQKWLVNVNSSRWWEQLEILLNEAFMIHDKLNEGLNVTLVAEWDVRGAQISALIQIISNPDYRTMVGFANVVERQFLHFGSWQNPASKKEKHEDKGIAFLQFLDCVYQLVMFYPLSFEFNEDMLTYLGIHLYSRKYGNFLFLTKVFQEEERLRCIKFGCIWEKIHKNKHNFINAFYVNPKQSDIYELKKSISMKNIRLWSSFFLRDIFMYGNSLEINVGRQNQRIMHQRHQAARLCTEELRRKIAEQHRLITEKRKELKELEDNYLE